MYGFSIHFALSGYNKTTFFKSRRRLINSVVRYWYYCIGRKINYARYLSTINVSNANNL